MTPYYQDDLVTIYHGDALDIAPTLGMVDLILTDPPFFMPVQHYAARTEWQKSWGDTTILARWWGLVADALVPLLRPTGHFVTFCDDESYSVFYPELYRRFDTLNCLVWDKGAIGMGSPWRHSHELLISARRTGSKWTGGNVAVSDVLRVRTIPSGDRFHPVDKPTELLRMLIGPTTAAGDEVLDPFLGGGSTLVAAKEAGRRAIGIEIEERYCEIAANRCRQEVLGLSA